MAITQINSSMLEQPTLPLTVASVTATNVVATTLNASTLSAGNANITFSNSTGLGAYFPIASGEYANTGVQFRGFQFKHIGYFQFRDASRYFDLKTNINGGMQMFLVIGYLYNSGNIFSIAGSYSYTTNTVINKFTQNLGNSTISDTYRTASNNLLCLKLDRGNSSYSEGFVQIYYHNHDVGTQNSCEITSYAQNNTAGAYYT